MSDETKCRACGDSGWVPSELGGSVPCGCGAPRMFLGGVFVSTPPTPDPRERGEDEIARLIADEHGIPLRSVLTVIAEVRESDALRAPAPSEAVADTELELTRMRQCEAYIRSLRWNPETPEEVRNLVIANVRSAWNRGGEAAHEARGVLGEEAWVVALAKDIARIAEGPDAGWGIYADLIRAHAPRTIPPPPSTPYSGRPPMRDEAVGRLERECAGQERMSNSCCEVATADLRTLLAARDALTARVAELEAEAAGNDYLMGEAAMGAQEAETQHRMQVDALTVEVAALRAYRDRLCEAANDALVIGLDYGTNNFSDAEVKSREDTLRAALDAP